MLRRIATLVTASLLVAGLFAAPSAQASSTEAARCDAMLIEIADKQHVVESLAASVAKGQADREAMAARARELAAAIAERKAEGKDASALQSQRDEILDEIAALEGMAAIVRAQLETLSAELATAEQAYVACVEASIEG